MKYLELESQIADKKREYHSNHEKHTGKEKADLTAQLIDLGSQLSTEIAKGANPCPHCKAPAIGVHKQSQRNSDIFEVGCPTCPVRAQAGNPELAVQRWNTEDFTPPLKDKKDQRKWFKEKYPDFKFEDEPAPKIAQAAVETPPTEEKK